MLPSHPATAAPSGNRRVDALAGLRIIGAGFGRTGTLSLKRALDDLGFGPTYHMEEVFRHPSHISRWLEHARGAPADWDELFARYGSGVDFPVSCVWEELAAHYPDAKVVLTVRDPSRWWSSTESTIYRARDLFPTWMRRLVPLADRYLEMNERLVWDGIFGGRFVDRDAATVVYEQHVERVVRTVPRNRLLVFEVSQGWAPLCEFLEVPVPSQPFPHLNDAGSIRRRIAAVRLGTRLLPTLVPISVLVAFRLRRRRLAKLRQPSAVAP